MPGIRALIQSVYRDLPKAEMKVARYILKNAEEAPLRSVFDVAEASSVSVASVSRFVRRVGFSDFRAFKVELAKDTTSSMPEIYRAITPGDSGEEIVRKVFRGYMQSIEDTLKIADLHALDRVSRILSQTGRILFFGIGGSAIVAQDAALRFSHLDIQAEAHSDPLGIVLQAKRLKWWEVAFGISHSGRTKIVCEAMKLAQEKGALTCALTNYMKAPLSAHAQYLFCTSFPEDRVKVAALSSRIAQLCVIDALYLLAAKHREHIWDIESLNRLVERFLRLG